MSHRESVGTAAVRLRPMGPDDAAFLYEVYASTRVDEMARLDWHEAQKRAFLRMQFEAQHKDYTARYRGARFDIIEVDREPVGRLYVDRRKREIRVIDIALLPAYRRRGIGGALMQEVLDEAAAAGKKVSIHVELYNPAMRFYERLGFAAIADGGVYRLMEWSPPTADRAEAPSEA